MNGNPAQSLSDHTVASFSLLTQVGLPDSESRRQVLKDKKLTGLPGPVLALLEWDSDPDVCFAAAAARSSADGTKVSRLALDPRLAAGGWRLAAHDVFRRNPHLLDESAVRSSPLWAEPEFRAKVAKETGAREVLEVAARDSLPEVRLAVATNRSLPDSVLSSLTGDRDPKVAAEARKGLEAREHGLSYNARQSEEYGDLARWSLIIRDLRGLKASSEEELLAELERASVKVGTGRILEQHWVLLTPTQNRANSAG